jgi:hypothetical protein
MPIALTDALLAYVSLGYLARRTAAFYRLARNLSLAAMALALAAILAAPVAYAILG